MNMLLNWIKPHWTLLVSLLLNVILCLCLMYNCQGKDPEIDVKYIPVHDTITVEKERIIEHTTPIFVTDTFIRVDSIKVQDSAGVWVELPMTWSQYKDTISTDSTEAQLEIDYHGIYAEIDSIKLDYKYYNKETTITKPSKRIGIVWCVGPYIGFGGHGNINTGTFGYGPEVGIGGSIGIGGLIEINKNK